MDTCVPVRAERSVRRRRTAIKLTTAAIAATVLLPQSAAAQTSPIRAPRMPRLAGFAPKKAEDRLRRVAHEILDDREAAEVAAVSFVKPEPTPEPQPAPVVDPAQVAIAAAHQHLGKPYVWGGTGPGGFDCSGLMLTAWRAAGVELPRTSRAQFAALPRVPLNQMRPGDLVFSGYRSVNHVGMYLGDGMMIHAPRSGRRIEISPLHSNVIGAGRPTG